LKKARILLPVGVIGILGFSVGFCRGFRNSENKRIYLGMNTTNID
jgi:hypothetical protein